MDLLLGVTLILLVAAVGFAAYLYATRGLPAHKFGTTDSRRLEEYGFYPFTVNPDGLVEFDADLFSQGVSYLLENRDPKAARELIVIGEQNLVRDTFSSGSLTQYKRLYSMYDGDDVVTDNHVYLENYRRLVNQLGRSFPNTGIEILLHNLVNPSQSLVAIENGAVTGRASGGGATNLVLDLKTRRERGEDKVNYELNIGSRKFKCTTVPIFRPEYGLVGAICINVDANFIRDVAEDADRLRAFLDNLLRTDFHLDENILSKDEYRMAMRGKRHYMDEAVRSAGSKHLKRSLKAIFFSDIVGFTSLMGADEGHTLQIMAANEAIHLNALANHGGQLLKRLGDGILASFDTASGAVECAVEVQKAVSLDGRFQLRLGIHLGEIVEDDGDVYGNGVNIASRIQGFVGAGEIGISGVVYENIKNKTAISATFLGDKELRNVDSPVTLYTIVPGASPKPA